jgi:hypothetical protein
VNAGEVIILRRHELMRVVASLDGGRAWSQMSASAYTAHAIYRAADITGHVIGTVDGWWWGVQTRPGQTPQVTRAEGPREACLSARGRAKRLVYERTQRMVRRA